MFLCLFFYTVYLAYDLYNKKSPSNNANKHNVNIYEKF